MCGRLERIQRCDKSNKRIFSLSCREPSSIKNCGPDYVSANGSIRLVKVRVTRQFARASPSVQVCFVHGTGKPRLSRIGHGSNGRLIAESGEQRAFTWLGRLTPEVAAAGSRVCH